MTEPITKVIDGVEAVGYMNTKSCVIPSSGSEQIKCLEFNNAECKCPGADLNTRRGDGIWIEKQRYLELRLLGELP